MTYENLLAIAPGNDGLVCWRRRSQPKASLIQPALPPSRKYYRYLQIPWAGAELVI